MADQKKEPQQILYTVGEVATQTEQVIVNLEGQPITTNQALAEILNEIKKIRELLRQNL